MLTKACRCFPPRFATLNIWVYINNTELVTVVTIYSRLASLCVVFVDPPHVRYRARTPYCDSSWWDPWSHVQSWPIRASLSMLHEHQSLEFSISSCKLSPGWLGDVPERGFGFLFLAWHLMCTYSLRRHGLFSTWGHVLWSPCPIVLTCPPLFLVTLSVRACVHLLCLGAALSIFLLMCCIIIDPSVIFPHSPILSSASIYLELTQFIGVF